MSGFQTLSEIRTILEPDMFRKRRNPDFERLLYLVINGDILQEQVATFKKKMHIAKRQNPNRFRSGTTSSVQIPDCKEDKK